MATKSQFNRVVSTLIFCLTTIALHSIFATPAFAATKRVKALISASWNASPNENQYVCSSVQAKSDMYITSFSGIAPEGTYEMIVTVLNSAPPSPGTIECDRSTYTFDYNWNFGNPKSPYASGVYAWGPGTQDYTLPAGVAVHIRAGQYILLNVHVLNNTAGSLSGTSGVAVQTSPASKIQHEAELIMAGTLSINIPNDGQTHTASGGCFAPKNTTIFAISPSLGYLGTRTSFSINGSTILDAPYSDTSQLIYPSSTPVTVNAGDQITTTCSYVNNTGSTVGYGEAYTSAKCFTATYRYPADPNDGIWDCITDALP